MELYEEDELKEKEKEKIEFEKRRHAKFEGNAEALQDEK